MPMYDIRCPSCGTERIDVLQKIDAEQPLCECGSRFERAWLSQPSNVIGDEIDISIRHGLCHPDGTPRRFRSREELKRATAASRYMNYVEHQGVSPDTDKSPHTQRWF